MTNAEAFDGVKTVLTRVSGAKASSITKKDKLRDYVPVPGAMGFALEIDRVFPKLSLTDLVNALYDPIATVGDLVQYVIDEYEVE